MDDLDDLDFGTKVDLIENILDLVEQEEVEVPFVDFIGTEEGYQEEPRLYVKYQCGYQCRLEGVERADIVVGDLLPAEIKKNPTQAEYDRLLGRLTRMHRAENFAVGVIYGVKLIETFLDFRLQIERIFGDGSVAIVQN